MILKAIHVLVYTENTKQFLWIQSVVFFTRLISFKDYPFF